MKFLRINILLLFLFLGKSVSFAQIIDESQIKQYTIADGLSLSYISALYQDKNDFIWIGTQDGLNRFDGYSFIQYRHSATNKYSISNNYIKGIAEMNNSLWVTTEGGLNRYLLGEKKFYLEDAFSFKKSTTIDGMLTDGNFLWVNSTNGIYKLDTKKGSVEYFEHYNDYFNSYCYSCYYPIIDLRNKILVASKDGLFLFDKKSETYQRYARKYPNINSLPSNDILSFKKINNDSILIGTDKGLSLFLPQKRRFINYIYKGKNQRISEFRNVINDIELDPAGFYWVATKLGLLIFDPKEKKLKDNTDKIPALSSIQKTGITCLLLDRSKALWVGTSDTYLMKISRRKLFFKRLKYLSHTKWRNIRAINKDKHKHLWVGTQKDGIFLLDKNYKPIKRFTPENSGLKTYFILSFFENANEMLIGTDNGAYSYNYDTKKIKSFSFMGKAPNSLPLKRGFIYNFAKDKSGNLWIASSYGLFRVSNKKIVTHYIHNEKNKNSLSNNSCYKIFVDNKNTVWVATQNGLNKLVEPGKNIFVKYFEGSGKWGLPGNSVLNIVQDTSRNYLWISTENGLAAMDTHKGVQHILTSETGLINDYVYATILSNKNNLWLATNRGIVQVNSQYHTFFFDNSDGLQDYEFNLGAYFKDKEGTIFFGGNKGINYFNPANIKVDSLVPKVRINSIQYSQNGITKEIFYVRDKQYSFYYKGLHLQINFILPDYTAIGKNYFRYKLIGLDEHWNYLGNKHSVSFAQLPIGSYSLELQGANNHGVWRHHSTKFNFEINPGTYNSPAAYILYTFIAILFIFLGILYITARLRKENNLFRQKEKDADKIKEQREKLMLQNKNLHDSMTYAKRIIDAMMPSEKDFKRIFPDSFIVHIPKEVVSGDFFWITEKNGLIYFAAVDCTGHGIPGAFMSIIGVELLQNIVKKQNITEPSKILNELSIGIEKVLSKDNLEEKAISDGMDMALCAFDKKKGLLYYAGAYNPLYIIRNNSLIEYKADRISIGSLVVESNYIFATKIIKLEPNDIIYIFSDGYTDQFGGPEGKKFKHRRFKHLLTNIHGHHVDLQRNAIINAFEDWIEDEEQIDDVLVIGIRPIYNLDNKNGISTNS